MWAFSPPAFIAAHSARWVAAVVLALPCSQTASASKLRVAWVGNSYTFFNDLPSTFATLCSHLFSGGVVVEHGQVTVGGSSIFMHANMSLPMGVQTLQMLTNSTWDFVVLQDESQSAGGGRNTDSDLGPGVSKQLSLAALRGFFSAHLGGATPVLYSTWGRHSGDPRNAECCGYASFLSMNRLTTEGYHEYAEALQTGSPALISPCGRAFELVFNSSAGDALLPSSNFSCLYHHDDAEPGGGGCRIDRAGSGGHPSPFGTYLIANVFAGTLLRQSTVGVQWAPDGVTSAQRDLAQRMAHQAVFGKRWSQGLGHGSDLKPGNGLPSGSVDVITV